MVFASLCVYVRSRIRAFGVDSVRTKITWNQRICLETCARNLPKLNPHLLTSSQTDNAYPSTYRPHGFRYAPVLPRHLARRKPNALVSDEPLMPLHRPGAHWVGRQDTANAQWLSEQLPERPFLGPNIAVSINLPVRHLGYLYES